MTLDTTARATAYRLTQSFGKDVTLRRIAKTTYDPSTGAGGEDATPVDYIVKVTPPSDYMLTDVGGTLIESGDMVVSMPALNAPVEPDEDTDKVIVDKEVWNVKAVGRLWSGELVAMYNLLLTR